MKKLTGSEAIELSIQQWELIKRGYSKRDAYYRIARKYSVTACFLCDYVKYKGSNLCGDCPLKVITGKDCHTHNKNLFRGDPESALSLLLAIQYEWDRIFVHKK